jgi:hypothetical protein
VLIVLKDPENSPSRSEALPKGSHCEEFPIARICVIASK